MERVSFLTEKVCHDCPDKAYWCNGKGRWTPLFGKNVSKRYPRLCLAGAD